MWVTERAERGRAVGTLLASWHLIHGGPVLMTREGLQEPKARQGRLWVSRVAEPEPLLALGVPDPDGKLLGPSGSSERPAP